MKYQIKDGTVSLKGETIFSHIDFEIRGNEKIALVGKNGAGKTTLLRLIAGELSLDRDDKRLTPGVILARNVTIGMLRQNATEEKEKTVAEMMESLCPVKDSYARERYDFEQEYDRVFTGFGFAKHEKNKKLGEFSGGQQTKIAMIRLLLSKPDILLLDEPTNHLDVQATQWLEEYIKHYEKAVVIVSHDRFFLDTTVDIVYELDEGKLHRYVGNYSAFKKQREKKRQSQMKNYLAQQQEVERLTVLIEKFKHKPKKAAMARSKKKILERMEKIIRPSAENVHIFTDAITPKKLGSKWVMDMDQLCIGYETPLQEITMRIRRGQKIGIIGANGTGKTTFLKTILGLVPPLSGKVQTGNQIEIGYFDQYSSAVQSEKRVFAHFHDRFPAYTVKEVKTILSHYLFGEADAGKKVSELSGGEKSRLALAEILEERPNLLLLDEPTNHMDIPAKETLESAFQAYTGTILFISHDRYFIKEVATALLIFEEDCVTWYPFGYEHYLNHLKKRQEFGWAGAEAVAVENTRLLEEWKEIPEKTRMQGARFSTEQSYADWQLTLAADQLAKVKETWDGFWDKTICGVLSEELEKQMERGQMMSAWEQALCQWKEQYAHLETHYTQACISWYEKWMEYEKVFEDYKDYH